MIKSQEIQEGGAQGESKAVTLIAIAIVLKQHVHIKISNPLQFQSGLVISCCSLNSEGLLKGLLRCWKTNFPETLAVAFVCCWILWRNLQSNWGGLLIRFGLRTDSFRCQTNRIACGLSQWQKLKIILRMIRDYDQWLLNDVLALNCNC